MIPDSHFLGHIITGLGKVILEGVSIEYKYRIPYRALVVNGVRS